MLKLRNLNEIIIPPIGVRGPGTKKAPHTTAELLIYCSEKNFVWNRWRNGFLRVGLVSDGYGSYLKAYLVFFRMWIMV